MEKSIDSFVRNIQHHLIHYAENDALFIYLKKLLGKSIYHHKEIF